mmetsp:Transcript_79821/g.222253  ORF Transcript_79821/g.222253 Transcript_79821/m.222253 type:complete len:221 (+) Transcript_79821:65-727(+)
MGVRPPSRVMGGSPDNSVALPVLVRSLCRLWDSPVVLVGVWVGVAFSSVAVLAQHQRLVEAQANGCAGSATATLTALNARGGRDDRSGVAGTSPAIATELRRVNRVHGSQASSMAEVLERLSEQATEVAEKSIAVAALVRIGENVQTHPEDAKYTTIWKRNPTFQKVVGHLPCAGDAMRRLGFSDSENVEAWQFRSADSTLLETSLIELRREQAVFATKG